MESILASGERTPDLLEAPAAEAFPEIFDSDMSSLIGARLGAYEVTELIGSGGMGAVFCARRADGQFEQSVAIKIIKRRVVAQDTIRRFRTERQMLATLDHPNIARLLDGGVTADGLPFLVMEYVDGRSIDQFCDDRRLATLERLQLFRQVCAAVTYAHRNLVVHRDLKPANILVTPEGAPGAKDGAHPARPSRGARRRGLSGDFRLRYVVADRCASRRL